VAGGLRGVAEPQSFTEHFDLELREELVEFPGLLEAVAAATRGEEANVEVDYTESTALSWRMLSLFGRHLRVHAEEIDRLRADLDHGSNSG
jgi:hypothetical protein